MPLEKQSDAIYNRARSNTENQNGSDVKPRKVPLVNMDLHYYARQTINRFIEEGILPKTGNTVIRFDAHNDEIIPLEMSSLCPLRAKSVRPNMYHEYGTEIWLREAVSDDGSLEHIIWVKSPWALQVEDGHRTLENKVTVDVKTLGKSIFESGEEDYEGFKTIFKKYLSPGDPYILDLAFCFFSADNPFAEEYRKAKNFYPKMKELFKIPMPASNEEDDIENAVRERYTQLDELRKIFDYIHEHRSLPDPKNHPVELFEKIAELREDLLKHYSEDAIKWNYIYSDGVYASDYLCPFHLTSRQDIEKLIQCVGKLLDILQTPPSLIILGVMYDYDRYTPKKDRKFITKSLEDFFKSRYDIKIEYLEF